MLGLGWQVLAWLAVGAAVGATPSPGAVQRSGERLPDPTMDSRASLMRVLSERRTTREFGPRSLSNEEVATLCWSAQGITGANGARTAPSAGAIHPLRLYVVLPDGIYRYDGGGHRLDPVARGDRRGALSAAALGQAVVHDAAAVFVFAGDYGQTASRYDGRAERFVDIEVGHAAQNLLLAATALHLATTPVGAFDDAAVARVVGVERRETPVYLVAVGAPR